MKTKRNGSRYLPGTLIAVLLAVAGGTGIDRNTAPSRGEERASRTQPRFAPPTTRPAAIWYTMDIHTADFLAEHRKTAESKTAGSRKPGKSRPAGKEGRRSKSKKKAKEKKPLLAKFMRAKLTASSQILEGLCTENYDLIIRGAKALRTMSSAEAWRVSNDALYREHSAEFRRAVDRLLKAGQNQKIDSAALAWTKTTLSCIECHRWVRAMLISRPDQ